MTQYEKVGVLVITGLVAVILALALFGTGSEEPLDRGEVLAQEEPNRISKSHNEDSEGKPGKGEPFTVGAAPWYLISDEDDQPRELPLIPNRKNPIQMASTRSLEHRIQSGDNLYDLAKKYLGNGNRYREIVDANPGLSAKRLQLGKVIHIPSSKKTAPESRLRDLAEKKGQSKNQKRKEKKSVGTRSYTVRKGDTLSGLAKKFLNDSNSWQTIYAMNRGVLSRPESLREGQEIQVPNKP